MKLLNRVTVILLLIIPAGILYSQSIKDVPDNFKKDLKEYLKNEEEKDAGEDAGGFQIDPSLYSKFQVPEFTYKQLKLGSDELLNFSKTGDNSDMGINIEGDYNILTRVSIVLSNTLFSLILIFFKQAMMILSLHYS